MAGADEVRAGALFLGGDERAQHAVDGLVEGADDGVVVVEAGAIDADDELRAGALERLALERFERVAANLAVEVAGGGMALSRARPAQPLTRSSPVRRIQPSRIQTEANGARGRSEVEDG